MHRAVKLMIVAYLCSISMIFLIPTGIITDPADPENNGIVLPNIDRDLKGEAQESPSIARVDKNRDRIHDDLAIKMLEYLPDEFIEVIVSFERQPTTDEFASIKAIGGAILQVYSIIPACCVRIPRKVIPELSNIRSVCIVEGLATCRPLLIDSTRQARERPFVWDRGYQGDPNTAIAILDTGIDATHPDLAGKVIYWYDFSTDSCETPIDIIEHGTHCASIATGTGAHSDGEYFQETYGNLTSDVVGSRNYYPTKIYSTGYLTLGVTWDNEITGNTPCLKLGVRNSSMTDKSTNFSTSPYVWTSTIPLFPGTYDLIVENNQSAGSRNYVISAKIPAGNTGDNYPEHLRGAAPGSKIVALKVFTNNEVGSLSVLLAALDWVHLNYRNYNITTISMSLGFTGIAPSLDSAVNNLVQQDGIVVVAAAGNYFPYIEIGSPGSASACITVGAVNKADQMTTYSSNGDWDYHPTGKPDIVAPGGSVTSSGLAPNLKILAADSSYSDTAGIDYDTYEMLRQPDPYFGGYQQMAGTSMACPHVAGIVQLLIDAWPGGWKWDPADALKIKQILCMSGVEVNSAEIPSQLPTLDRGSKDLKEGWGKVNADAALNLTRDYLQLYNSYAIQFGNRPTDLKNYGGRVYLEAGRRYNFTLSVPSGCDADLYLWGNNPTESGDPILVGKSASPILGQSEKLIGSVNETGYYYLTAKLIQGPLSSMADLYLDEIISIIVQNPLPGSLSFETTAVQFNISVYGSGGEYDSTWYTLDGENNVPFTGNACVVIPRGFHEVIFSANDSFGAVETNPISFGVRSDHPEDHVTLTITQPVNGQALTNIQTVNLKVAFTSDLGSLDTCWYILDYGLPTKVNDNALFNVSFGPHRLIAYANNTLGEEVASQVIKFTLGESSQLDFWMYFLLAIVGFAIGAIAIGIHHFLSKPPRPPEKRAPSAFPSEPKFSLSKAAAISSRISSSPPSNGIKPHIVEEIKSPKLEEIKPPFEKSPLKQISATSPPTASIQPAITPSISVTPSDSTSSLKRLLNLLPVSSSGSPVSDAQNRGVKTPSSSLAPNEIKCPQCGANLTSGIKTCPFCKWILF